MSVRLSSWSPSGCVSIYYIRILYPRSATSAHNFTWVRLEFHLQIPHFLLPAACSSSLNSCLFWVSVFVKCPVGLSWVTRKQRNGTLCCLCRRWVSNRRTLTDPGWTLKEATWLTLHHGTHTAAPRRAICCWESWQWGLYLMQLFALIIRWELKFDMIWEIPL